MKNANETKKVRAGRYTVCLDTNKASADTYCNWETFRLTRHAKDTYLVERLTNRDGNGQAWGYTGWISGQELRASFEDRGMPIATLTVLARHFGLSYANETILLFPNARVWRPTGRKTAAPSLLRRKVRDKNENQMRRKVETIDLAAAMAERRK